MTIKPKSSARACTLLLICLCLIQPRISLGSSGSDRATSVQDSDESPQAIFAKIRDRIQALQMKPQPALYERHLESVLALCKESMLQLSFAGSRRDEMTTELTGYFKGIDAALKSDGGQPDSYLTNGRYSLVLARLAQPDDTIQFYLLSLPPHWDPNRAYPLYVSLHGGGSSLPAAYAYYALTSHPETESSESEFIGVSPWMRGNHNWHENSDFESDIWQAIAEVQTVAKTDPKRWYLAGHSAGGDAVWAIVQRTPDLWAAAGMMSGSDFSVPIDFGLIPNMVHVPFYMWRGDHDPTLRIPAEDEIRAALIAAGNPPKYVVSKGLGHMYRAEDVADMQTWLFQHVRHRPDHFVFIIDTPRHRGIWGISIPRKELSGLPQQPYFLIAEPRVKFECWIIGSTVRIRTWDARKLSVDLGPQGLEMTGKVTLIVNGRQRFEGEVPEKAISLSW